MTNYGTAPLKVDAFLYVSILYARYAVRDGIKTIWKLILTNKYLLL